MDPAPLVLGADPPSRLENELVAAAVPALGAAARTRANAVFYGFCALSVGFVITMAALVRESYSWRNTLTSESAAWRTFVKEEIHAMGLAL